MHLNTCIRIEYFEIVRVYEWVLCVRVCISYILFVESNFKKDCILKHHVWLCVCVCVRAPIYVFICEGRFWIILVTQLLVSVLAVKTYIYISCVIRKLLCPLFLVPVCLVGNHDL